jgi:hypothetical protein
VGILHDGFEPVVGSVFPNIVRVQDSQVREFFLRLLLCYVLEADRSCEFGYSKGSLPSSRARTDFSCSALSDSNPDYHIALFGFVS